MVQDEGLSSARNQPVEQCWIDLITGHRRQVAVLPSGVPRVAYSVSQGEVWSDLPAVSHVDAEPVIILSTSGITELRDFSEESLAVADQNGRDFVVKGISRSAGEGSCSRVGLRGQRIPCSRFGSKPIERCESAAQNLIETESIAKNMGAKNLASVVLNLLVRLEGRLRGKSRRSETSDHARRSNPNRHWNVSSRIEDARVTED